MELLNGQIWSIPIILPIQNQEVTLLEEVALVDEENSIIAIMVIEDIFTLDLKEYSQKIFQTQDLNHPGVSILYQHGARCIGGETIILKIPRTEEIDTKY